LLQDAIASYTTT
ncbi:unnamed protein product, partial [Rotaria sordida]